MLRSGAIITLSNPLDHPVAKLKKAPIALARGIVTRKKNVPRIYTAMCSVITSMYRVMTKLSK